MSREEKSLGPGLAITHFIKEERWHPPKLRWEDEEIGR
jgi:hypothetical protein